MTDPINVAEGGLDTCNEGGTVRGMYEPCDAPAVAVRLDPDERTPYPVCARHARGDMVPLEEVLRPTLQDLNTLAEVRAAHAQWQRDGNAFDFRRALNTLLVP